ncbi:MAG: sugar phosphate isomerase/epimerase [Thaumarchaeota archaeon]|nr:sugar phosphate isomerase/epimerase [Nitrososphaerota archaeon]
MKIGATAWYSKILPLEDSLAWLSRLGYEGVEIPGFVEEIDGERRRYLKKLLKELNLELVSVSAGIPFSRNGERLNLHSSNDEIRRASVQYVRDCIDLVVSMDGHLVYVASVVKGNNSEQKDYEFFSESLDKCADYAYSNSVQVALEPFPFGAIPSAKIAQELISKLNRSNVGLLLDTGHLALSHESFSISPFMIRKLVMHVHFNNNNYLQDKHWKPTFGNIVKKDFEIFVKSLKEGGYDKYVSIELLNVENVESELNESKQFLSEILSSV